MRNKEALLLCVCGFRIEIEVEKRFQTWNRSLEKVSTGFGFGMDVEKWYRNWNRTLMKTKTGVGIGIEVEKRYRVWNLSLLHICIHTWDLHHSAAIHSLDSAYTTKWQICPLT